MMDPQECLRILTDQSRQIEEKSAAIADYLQGQFMVARPPETHTDGATCAFTFVTAR